MFHYVQYKTNVFENGCSCLLNQIELDCAFILPGSLDLSETELSTVHFQQCGTMDSSSFTMT